MFADGDENASEKKQRQLETLKKRALSSDIMRDLQKQYDDRPEEIVVCYVTHISSTEIGILVSFMGVW